MKIYKIKKIFIQGFVLIKYIYYKIYCFFVKGETSKYQDCWLVQERGNDARDNGYYFYKYVRENYPNIDIRYVITKNSPDFDKIKKIGKYIIYGSRDHYIAFLSSQMLISTHLSGCSPNVGLFFRLQRYGLLKLKGKLVCLKHGITKDYLPFFNPKDTNLSLLIAGAKPEYDYFVEKNGFSPDVVKYTGFARFDGLKKIKSKQILFMPTHRIYMHNMNNNEFIKSDYYQRINGLINNKNIINLLEKNDLTLVFYPHIEFQRYINLFSSSSKRIIIAGVNNYDVRHLLINSSLLITDYSSVFFDFAYMEKPVIYYQFDYDMYRNSHYKEGYFDYRKDGFGPICLEEKEVVNEMKNSIKNNFKINNSYFNNIKSFFIIRDNNNCKRIYEEIKKIINK